MHEIINTSLHSRKVLTVPTDWDDDISEIGTTCPNNNSNKFSPLNVLRRKKHESPKNFQIVRPTEESHFLFVEEERELTEFEPEYYWENSRENEERRDPPQDMPDEGTSIKQKLNHPFFPDKSPMIRNHRGDFFDSPREPLIAVAAEGFTVKTSSKGEERQARKPNKVSTRSGREEQSTDSTVQMSLVLQQRKKSTKKLFDMAKSSKKNLPTISESVLANKQVVQQEKGVPSSSFQRHTHPLETKRTQNTRSIDEMPSECDDSKAKPTVSAAIVRTSTARPVSKWFKPRKTIIPLVTGKAAESNIHAPDSVIYYQVDSRFNQHCVDAGLPNNMAPQSQIEKKDDPFNQLCRDIWSSGTELLSTTSAVLDSIGVEAMRSLQTIVSATVVQEPAKAIMPSQGEPIPEDKAQVATPLDTSDKLEHPCIVRNFENETKNTDTTVRTANHVFNLTYIAPQHGGQETEKQYKDKSFKKKNSLPTAAKAVGQNSLRWTKQGDGQLYDI